MYKVSVSYKESQNYIVKAANYEINVDVSKKDDLNNATTPIHLFLGSLGACLAVYLERYLVGVRIEFSNFSIDIKSDICKESLRYLKDIDVILHIHGANLNEIKRNALLDFIANCPVHNTLIGNPKVNFSLREEDGL